MWQVLSTIVNNHLFLPSPIEAARSLWVLLQMKAYYLDVSATLIRCILGILLSFVAGTIFAFLGYKSRTVEAILSLPVNLLKSIPIMAIIIYALILLTSNMVPVFVCFLMCFPIVYINILSGLKSLPQDILEMASVFKVTQKNMVFKVLLPSIIPQVKASLDLLAGLSWKAVVSAEVLAIPTLGMGFNLMDSKYYLETENLFAWILSIVFFSYCFEIVLKKLTNLLSPKEYCKSKIDLSNNLLDFSKPQGHEIKVNSVSKVYGNQMVLDNISINFDKQVKTALVAPSGFGKTTLLRLIANLESCTSGEIIINKEDRISYLFQEDRLVPWLNIYDNLALILADKLPKEESQKRIEKILNIMELWKDKNKLPGQLSGGMRHRVAIARAFIFPADILLLDEPFKGLDLPLIDRIIDGAWVRTTKDKTVIFSTHIPEISSKLSDKIINLDI